LFTESLLSNGSTFYNIKEIGSKIGQWVALLKERIKWGTSVYAAMNTGFVKARNYYSTN
jgi:predicted transcriptional regulator